MARIDAIASSAVRIGIPSAAAAASAMTALVWLWRPGTAKSTRASSGSSRQREHALVGDRPLHIRARQIALRAFPVVVVEMDARSAVRATGRVHAPIAARGNPHHDATTAGCKHHCGIIGVRNNGRRRRRRDRLSPSIRGLAHLRYPIELIAREVQQHQHVDLGGGQQRGDIAFVDLQHRSRTRRGVTRAR